MKGGGFLHGPVYWIEELNWISLHRAVLLMSTSKECSDDLLTICYSRGGSKIWLNAQSSPVCYWVSQHHHLSARNQELPPLDWEFLIPDNKFVVNLNWTYHSYTAFNVGRTGQQNRLKLSLKGSRNVRVVGRIFTSNSANFTAIFWKYFFWCFNLYRLKA